MNANISTKTLADRVEEQIIKFIKDNKLVPGDYLPNEMEFVEMFGISRNVVREALSRLRMLGLIQSRTNRGIILTEPPLTNSFYKIFIPQLLGVEAIKEMMGFRITLEIGIAEFFFENLTDSDILQLENIVSRQKAIGTNYLTVEDEMVFHTKIYEIAGNNFILQFNEIMHPVFVFAKKNYESYFQTINEKLKKSFKIIEHSDILNLIKTRDKKGYQKAIRGHLEPYWQFISDSK